MMSRAISIGRRDDGQTTVEYALIATGVIGLAVAAFSVLSPAIGSIFIGVVDRLSAL